MEISTSELCDRYPDMVDVLEPILRPYGGKATFAGNIVSIKCFEDTKTIREVVEQEGSGKVLLIDGGGSTRRALVDVEIAETALDNNWVGIICYGSVRDVDALEELELGIHAVASIPVGADSLHDAEVDIPVHFGSVTFLPDDYIYADNTGVILSQEPLLNEEDDDEDTTEEYDELDDE